MDLFDAIAKRHSYRGPFLPGAVPREDLRRIVQAGIQAPSGYNGQSTSFVIVDDPATLSALAEIVPGKVVQSAPALIACVMDPGATRDKEFAFGVQDCAAAVENILLAVTAMGYASVWLEGALLREERAARVGRLLGVPSPREVRVLLPVGRPAEDGRQGEKKPFEERAWFGSFRGSSTS